VLKDFDTEADEAIKAAPTESSRNWLKERLGQVRLGVQQDALAFEARKGAESKVNGLARSADQARTAAEFRPEDFSTLAAEQRAAIEASGLPADAQRALLQQSVESIASASVQGMIRGNPYRALTLLNEEPLRAQDGSPALRNPDGSVSTMLTATVEDERLNDGQPTNIPTVWDGKALSPEEAIEKAAASARKFPAFTSVADAVAAAEEASENKGRQIGPERLAVSALPFEQRQALRRTAEAEIRQRDAAARTRSTEARQAMDDRLRDISAAAQMGIPVTDVPPEAVLKSLYGDHEGAQRYQGAQRAAQLSSTVAQMHTLPTGELLQQAAASRPTRVAGAATQAQLHGFLANRTQDIVQAREKDAAGYLTQYSPAVQEAWNALQATDDPEAAQQYMATVRAEKERLGIASQDVLPAAYASAVVDRLTRPQNSEGLAVAMTRETERWGAAWPQVYRQVAKDLPSAALVIGSGIPKQAADTLALMSQKTSDELKALVPAGHTPAKVDDEVAEALANFSQTFGPEGASTLSAMRDAVQRVAIGYMGNGTAYEKAIKQAASDVADSRYSYLDFRGKKYRVPAEMSADHIDAAATRYVSIYAHAPGTVQVPPGTEENVILAQVNDHVRRNGYWRTAPDESGLRLYVGGSSLPSGQVDAMGNPLPVQLSWEQLGQIADQVSTEDEQRARKAQRERETRQR
jgi:hypothetical protein